MNQHRMIWYDETQKRAVSPFSASRRLIVAFLPVYDAVRSYTKRARVSAARANVSWKSAILGARDHVPARTKTRSVRSRVGESLFADAVAWSTAAAERGE